jgi:hydroxysqualene synthase
MTPNAATPSPAPDGQTVPPRRVLAEHNYAARRHLAHGDNRDAIVAFFRFARMADDIADDHRLDSVARAARLDALDAILAGKETGGPGSAARGASGPAAAAAFELRERLLFAALPVDHARHLLQALRADAGNRASRSWPDLLAYCRYASAPVARLLLEAHGAKGDAQPAAEALAAAFHILNLLQDCKVDYMTLRRVYLPSDWLNAAGASPHDLGNESCTPALRRVIDRVLDGVGQLQALAGNLPAKLTDPRLKLEAETLVRLTRILATKLRHGDPLAKPVTLTSWDKLVARAGAYAARFMR